jgi:hypothetical protein
VITPLTEAYQEALLTKLRAKDLSQAEEIATARIVK